MLSAGESLLHDLQGMARFRTKASELHQYLLDYSQARMLTTTIMSPNPKS